MRPNLRLTLAAALIAVVAPAAAADATPAAPAFTAAQLAAAPTDSWLTNGGSLSNQRFSPLTLLNRSNVAQLKAKWRASLNGSGLSPGRATSPSRSYMAIPSTS
jgi:glucose dehydrogenase